MTMQTIQKQPPVQSGSFKHARTTARAARRLASRTATVSIWWDRLPNPKPNYLTPATLALSLGCSIRRMATALRWLGWRRIIRRVRGKQMALWVPPSTTLEPRPRGRPLMYYT